jgi:hypothetical protein
MRRARRSADDPGRVLSDPAVMFAEGGEAISDLAVPREAGSVRSAALDREGVAELEAPADRGEVGRATGRRGST